MSMTKFAMPFVNLDTLGLCLVILGLGSRGFVIDLHRIHEIFQCILAHNFVSSR